jgi:hypothetical protein
MKKSNENYSVVLTKEQKEKLLHDLIKKGEATILGVVTLRMKKHKMKGREHIDPENPDKGFRVTDMNKTTNIITASVTKYFKRSVNRQR